MLDECARFTLLLVLVGCSGDKDGGETGGSTSSAGDASTAGETGAPTTGGSTSEASTGDGTTSGAGSTGGEASTGASDSTGGGASCVTPADCPPTEACVIAVCDPMLEQCTTEPEKSGVPAAEQLAGDCLQLVCDGLGGATNFVDDKDTPTPDTACKIGVCMNGVSDMTPVPEGTACAEDGGTVCDGDGACVKE